MQISAFLLLSMSANEQTVTCLGKLTLIRGVVCGFLKILRLFLSDPSLNTVAICCVLRVRAAACDVNKSEQTG